MVSDPEYIVGRVGFAADRHGQFLIKRSINDYVSFKQVDLKAKQFDSKPAKEVFEQLFNNDVEFLKADLASLR